MSSNLPLTKKVIKAILKSRAQRKNGWWVHGQTQQAHRLEWHSCRGTAPEQRRLQTFVTDSKTCLNSVFFTRKPSQTQRRPDEKVNFVHQSSRSHVMLTVCWTSEKDWWLDQRRCCRATSTQRSNPFRAELTCLRSKATFMCKYLVAGDCIS